MWVQHSVWIFLYYLPVFHDLYVNLNTVSELVETFDDLFCSPVEGNWEDEFKHCLYIAGERNTWGNDRLFVGIRHPSYSFLEGLYEGEKTTEVRLFFFFTNCCEIRGGGGQDMLKVLFDMLIF